MSNPLICPITLQIMTEPVLAPDGYTYEKSAIESWLRRHGTSPHTRFRMRISDLVVNRAVRDLIQQQQAEALQQSALIQQQQAEALQQSE
jgi:hypothetical protein